MKKTLIALAAVAATSAFAQSSVTLYGRLDAGIAAGKTTLENNGVTTDTNNNGVMSHNSVSSYWGIKGTEDLGGGMKANFKLEQDLFPATGNLGVSGASGGNTNAASFNRTSLVGIEGAFGRVDIGRDYNPMFSVAAASDVFGLSRLSTVGLAGNVGSTIDRQVIYTSPNFGGFTGKLSTGHTDMTGVFTHNAHASGVYANGPLYIGLGLGNMEAQPSAGGQTTKTEGSALTVTYDFGVAKLYVGHITKKVTQNDKAGAADNTETNLGVNVPFGKLAVQAVYGRNTQKDDTAGATAEDRSGNDWGLGVTYDLSKRTTAFAKTGVINKLDGTRAGLSYNSKYTETNVGIRHVF